ncbi:glycosyltransferase [Streptococcus thalassemiae]|uniref:glycosyltransferase n=1 Tax=Streptococcus thalassemiae TaxID=2736608 RepID=UPI00158C35EB|nr:glycosyltransferase [Streptococcus thalassemiae]
MTVYNFNLLLGFEPNGVDVAQAHRLKIFRKLGVETYFVFTHWPSIDQLNYFLSKGYRYNELLFAQLLFTDQLVTEPVLSSNDMEMLLGLEESQQIDSSDQGKTYKLDNGEIVVFRYSKYFLNKVQYVDYFSEGYLLKREIYSTRKLVTDYFVLNYQNNQILAELGRRVYHNQDGSIALEEISLKKKLYYLLKDSKLITHEELMKLVINKLHLKDSDIVLMDRASNIDFARPLLEQSSGAKLGLVFHSEHTFGEHPFSYEYYYPVKYAHRLDFMITSTNLQAEILKESFQKEGQQAPQIYTIPVGSLKSLQYPDKVRQPQKIMTASRLIYSKRVDLAIRAVVLAHQKGANIDFSIFGQGMEYNGLKELICEYSAEDYIHLKGYARLDDEYIKHSIYLTASITETFGLTLMEAVGAGLAIVGFDVRYGNPTFILDGENGYLVPFEGRSDQELVEDMAQRLVELSSKDMEDFHRNSYQLARDYLEERILELWNCFLGEQSSKIIIN